ncbi:unnamed protein product, partial [Mesorhabditis belari]|uniref:UBC core domain-containing protein n=1 Tax=Mesorhabditis belari TaxID=2138241 RepID=A0AAF3E842_9BILA
MDAVMDDGEKQSTSADVMLQVQVQETTAAIEKTKELLMTAKASIVQSKELTDLLSQQTLDFGNYGQFGYAPYFTTRRGKRRHTRANAPVPTRLPVMTKNDIVVFLDEDRVALGNIALNTQIQCVTSLRYNTGRDLLPGHQVNVSTIPDDDQDLFDVNKLVVIDRGLQLGEKVGWAHQTYMKQPHEYYFPWHQEHKGLHGIVVDYKVNGDALILPEKKYVIRNVDLLKFDPLVMAPCKAKMEDDVFRTGFAYTKIHRQVTSVSYGGWIGEVLDQTNKVSLEYDKNFVITFIDDRKVVKLIPADGSCEDKCYIPGQLVNVRLRDLLDPVCSWNQEAPPELFRQTRGIKGRKSSVQCTVLSITPELLTISWKKAIDAKASPEPAGQLQGEECLKVQVIHRTRLVRAGDRLAINRKFLADAHICERSEFETALNKTFNEIVKKKENAKLAGCFYAGSTDLDDCPMSSSLAKGLVNHIRKNKMKICSYGEFQEEEALCNGQEPVFEPLEELPPVETTMVESVDFFKDEVMVEVVATQTKVSIMWSDGTISDDVDGRLLAPIPDKEMAGAANAAGIPWLFPGNVVQRKNYPLKGPVVGILSGPNTSIDINKFKNNDSGYGIVLSVNDEERFAKVQWLEVKYGKVVIQVKEVEDCPLFELSHQMEIFKISPGQLGILSESETSSRRDGLLESLFIAGRFLPNGQRVVRFLNGKVANFWPVEMRGLSHFSIKYGLGFSKLHLPSILKKDPLTIIMADSTIPNQNAEPPKKVQKKSPEKIKKEGMVQIFDGTNEWNVASLVAMDSSMNGDSEKSPLKKPKAETSQSHFVGLLPQDFASMSAAEDDLLSTSDSIDDFKLPIGFISSLAHDDFAQTLATIAAAAEIVYPKSSLANEIKRQCDLAKVKVGPMFFDVMNELVKLIEKDLLKVEELDYSALVLKAAHWENENVPEEVTTCLNSLLALPQCEQMLNSLKLALGVKTTTGNAKTSNSTLNANNGNLVSQDDSAIRSAKQMPKESNENGGVAKPVANATGSAFQMLPTCTSHKWLKVESASFNATFKRAIQKEYKMFAELPEGIFVRAYENRLDLLHAIIVGPRGTPFDSTPYFFEIKLPDEYPNKPPKVNFVPYSTEALNPNLYQEGKVCLSLLGTWAGKKSEKWDPNISNLQQVFLSIQGLILYLLPYWNEPGREHSKNDPQQIMASERYNEATTMSSIQYMERIFESPPPSFEAMIRNIVSSGLPDYRTRIESWFDENNSLAKPEYPLPRLSKGFQLALSNAVSRIQKAIDETSKANGEEAMIH